jgi:hypothetical protein
MSQRFISFSALCFSLMVSSHAGALSSTSVDAVTAATVNNKCKFNLPVLTADTSATVMWTEKETGGSASFCFGTTAPPATCRPVTSTERSSKTILLSGLTPKTTYYIYVEMTKSGETPYAASGSFTTMAPLRALSVAGMPNKSFSRVLENRLVIGSGIMPGDRVIQTDLTGRVVFSHVLGEGERSLPLFAKGHGVYPVAVMRGSITLEKFTFIAGFRTF